MASQRPAGLITAFGQTRKALGRKSRDYTPTLSADKVLNDLELELFDTVAAMIGGLATVISITHGILASPGGNTYPTLIGYTPAAG